MPKTYSFRLHPRQRAMPPISHPQTPIFFHLSSAPKREIILQKYGTCRRRRKNINMTSSKGKGGKSLHFGVEKESSGRTADTGSRQNEKEKLSVYPVGVSSQQTFFIFFFAPGLFSSPKSGKDTSSPSSSSVCFNFSPRGH